jgi:hypothetical protein
MELELEERFRIAASRDVPAVAAPEPETNLLGERGPRCCDCSGLGKVLTPGGRGASGCKTCRGTGIDERSMLLTRIETLEALVAQLVKRLDSRT